MKYFIYFSELKIDMLFEQMPLDLKRHLAAELKVDLKLVSATLSKAAAPETRFSRLEMVTNYLRANEQVGSIRRPKEYFSGALEMGWGPLAFLHDADAAAGGGMVMFGGTPDGTAGVALVGSSAHMLGGSGTPVHAHYASASFLRAIADGLQDLSEREIEENSYGTYNAARGMALFHKGSTQRVEFVARRFCQLGDMLIGSPLYVALP